jgi:uncharacterized RDD family membrane protein YckC
MTIGGVALPKSSIAAEPRQTLTSPERVVLQLSVAGPASRMLAYSIDQLVIILLEVTLVAAVILGIEGASSWFEETLSQVGEQLASPDTDAAERTYIYYYAFAALIALQLVVELAYFVGAEAASGGRSLGKRCMNLRVVRDGGLPITWRASLVRNLLRAVDVLPANYLVGCASMLVSSEGKRLGDLAAGTVVIRLDRPEAAPPLAFDSATDLGAFRFSRAQLARLRANERTLLRQTLRRIDSLDPARADAAVTRATEVLGSVIRYGPVEPSERRAFLVALLAATRVG